MKKTYILDTNVLLSDPNAIFNFNNHDIVIPFKVLEEIDKKKSLQDTIGSNARYAIRELDKLRERGSIISGIRLGKGKGFLSIKESDINKLPEEFKYLHTSSPDNRILAVAYTEKTSNPEKKVIIVSRDITVRVKADALSIPSQNYESDKVVEKKDQLYSGFRSVLVDDQIIDRFYNGEDISLEKEQYKGLYPNQFVMLISNQNDKKSALSQFTNYSNPIRRLNEYKKGIFNVIPKNKEQLFALNLLMNPKVPVVTLAGTAGCGKSLLSIAGALEQTLGKNSLYKKFVVMRPVIPMGNKDIGYLPGKIEEKLEPWIMPIVDNLRFLFGNNQTMLDEYIKDNIIEIEAMTFIRGRTINNAIMLIDEVQNCTAHELKTVVTRVGEGTKIILTGDLNQIDAFYLNEFTSGFTNVIEKFKSQEIAGHVTLTKGERSLVATIASKIL